jgi:hypothetical protein
VASGNASHVRSTAWRGGTSFNLDPFYHLNICLGDSKFVPLLHETPHHDVSIASLRTMPLRHIRDWSYTSTHS